MSVVDFSQLPPPDLIKVLDYEQILAQRKARFISLYPPEEQPYWTEVLTRESEPVTKILQENAYLELLTSNQRNQDARALLLAFSTGSDLDHIAVSYYGVTRLVITPANPNTVPPTSAVMESDEDLKERCLLSLSGFNTAGASNAYKFFSKSADGRVADASIISHEDNPCFLDVYITQHDSDDFSASQELIDKVQKALDPEDVRPVGDRPTVHSSTPVTYQIQARLYISQTAENVMLLSVAQERLQKYVKNSKKIGQSIRLSAIYAALHVDGVSRVEILNPTSDIVISKSQHAFCTGVDVQIGGTE
ncbi:baseplate assembly protein [Acinetobacter baumannii]|nr:baseplate J/gp47 family protein [Acinetobacter baumannii]EKU4658180.1 baseplate J/gp47 family protein [Acinetobacter baumannii]EKV5598995.1 baseplate J/gp47 family protein [Acinetobacter baumannii]EKV5699874.1 baseplate J/gp47 family protein [Acinetobacter baumannii]EKV6803123.1 baseplate J/gp47 family protein [Acinetobacter baumannii]